MSSYVVWIFEYVGVIKKKIKITHGQLFMFWSIFRYVLMGHIVWTTHFFPLHLPCEQFPMSPNSPWKFDFEKLYDIPLFGFIMIDWPVILMLGI